MKLFSKLVAFSAFSIATCAALFSVTGLGELFGGTIPVFIMAGALELGKLVSVSYLYRAWSFAPKLTKYYMVAASFVLTIITSIGIYGYLSSGYAKRSIPLNTSLQEITTLKTEQQNIEGTIERYQKQIDAIDSRRTQQEARLDTALARNFTRTYRETQRQLAQIDQDRKALQDNIAALSNKRDSLSKVVVSKTGETSSNSELGTFVYVANTIGVPLDTIVKWFILVVVLVFDPLSVSLILAYNSLKRKEDTNETPTPTWTPDTFTKPTEPVADVTAKEMQTLVREINTEQSNTDVWSTVESLIGSVSGSEPLPEEPPYDLYNERDELPYYMKPGYNWNTDGRWRTDPAAIKFKQDTTY